MPAAVLGTASWGGIEVPRDVGSCAGRRPGEGGGEVLDADGDQDLHRRVRPQTRRAPAPPGSRPPPPAPALLRGRSSCSSASSASSVARRCRARVRGRGGCPRPRGSGMPARAAPTARQSVRASMFRCPRSRASRRRRSTPSWSIARPGRGRVPGGEDGETYQGAWGGAGMRNFPTRLPLLFREAYRNRRSVCPR